MSLSLGERMSAQLTRIPELQCRTDYHFPSRKAAVVIRAGMWKERKIGAHNGYIVFCTHKRWNLSSPEETPLSQTPKAVQIPRAQAGGFLAVRSHRAEAPRLLHLSICWRQSKVIRFPTVIIVENASMSMCVQLFIVYGFYFLWKKVHTQ